jgi:hypothetical protein
MPPAAAKHGLFSERTLEPRTAFNPILLEVDCVGRRGIGSFVSEDIR